MTRTSRRTDRRRHTPLVVLLAAVLTCVAGAVSVAPGRAVAAIRTPAPEPVAPKSGGSTGTRTTTPARRTTAKPKVTVKKKTATTVKRTSKKPCGGKTVGLVLTSDGQAWATGVSLGLTNCSFVVVAVPKGDGAFQAALAKGLVPASVGALVGNLTFQQQRELAPTLAKRKIPYLELLNDIADDVAATGYAFQLTASFAQMWFTLPDLLIKVGGTTKVAMAASDPLLLTAFDNYGTVFGSSTVAIKEGDAGATIAAALLSSGADTLVVVSSSADRDRDIVANLQARSFGGRIVVSSDLGEYATGTYRLEYEAPVEPIRAEFEKAFPNEVPYLGTVEGYDAGMALEEALASTSGTGAARWLRSVDAVASVHNLRFEGGFPVHPVSFLYRADAPNSYTFLASAPY